MRSSAVVLLAVASAAAAQTGTSVTSASAIAVIPGTCPISIDARQQPRKPYLLTDSSHTTRPSYHVTIQPRNGRAIVQVVLALSGPSGLHLGNAFTPELADATETVVLNSIGDTTITPTRLTAVASFGLVSVTYTDGSRWQSSATNTCSIAPNGFVLVK